MRAATLISGDPHLAQDLLQDALVKLARVWRRVGTEHPEAYVRQVLYRDLISWRRRHRREHLRLRHALARLTVKQRAVLVLRFYEDLPEREVAETLGVGVGTVKSQTHAALTRLRAQLPELELERGGWQ